MSGVGQMGLVLQRGNDTSVPAGGFTAVADIYDVNLASTTDELDTTSFDASGGFEEIASGIRRGGSLTIEGYYNGSDATHQLISDDFLAGDANAREWEIVWKDSAATTTTTMFGWVQAYSLRASVTTAAQMSITIRITTPIDYDS